MLRALALLVGMIVSVTGVFADTASDAKEAKQAADSAKQAAAEAKQAAEDAKSGDSLQGDELTLKSHTYGFDEIGGDKKTGLVGLAGTVLRVIKEENGQLYVSVDKVPCVPVENKSNAVDDKKMARTMRRKT